MKRRDLLKGLPGAALIPTFLTSKAAQAESTPTSLPTPAEATAQERLEYHLAEFKRAAEELDPMIGHWNLMAPNGPGEPMRLYAHRVTGRYVGDGIYESGQEDVLGRRGQWEVRLTDVVIDEARTFMVECPGERMRLLEHVLETRIGRRIGDLP